MTPRDHRRRRARVPLVVALLVVAGGARRAAASEPVAAPPNAVDPAPAAAACGDDPVRCGKDYFEQGTRAFEAHDYAAAIRHFEQAQAIRPHPVISFNLALSLAGAGKVSAALQVLDQVLSDPATDPALKGRAQAQRTEVRARVAELQIELRDAATTVVEVDGVPRHERADALLLDPGPHHLKVTNHGTVVYDEQLSLGAGERLKLRLAPRSRAIDIVVVPDDRRPASPPPPAPAPTPRERGPSPVWFWGAAATTGVLLGATVASGVDTLRAHDAYERDLPRLTQAQADARVAAGHEKELRTNLLVGATVLGAAATAVLGVFVVDFGGGAASEVALAPGGAAYRFRF
jgi:hypothetical protein